MLCKKCGGECAMTYEDFDDEIHIYLDCIDCHEYYSTTVYPLDFECNDEG